MESEFIKVKDIGFGAIYELDGIKYQVVKVLTDNKVRSIEAKISTMHTNYWEHEFTKGIIEVVGYTKVYTNLYDSAGQPPNHRDKIAIFRKGVTNLVIYLGAQTEGHWVLQDTITKEIFRTEPIPFIEVNNI